MAKKHNATDHRVMEQDARRRSGPDPTNPSEGTAPKIAAHAKEACLLADAEWERVERYCRGRSQAKGAPDAMSGRCYAGYQTTQEDNRWAPQALLLVRRWWPEHEIVAVADSAYASLRLLASCQRYLPRPVTFITRLRLDAALYDPAPPRRAGQIGRPRLKGERLPNLSVVAEDPSTTWTPTTVEDWYGGGERTVEVASATAVWYSTGLPAVPIRWVVVRDPQGEFATQALVCTDLGARPEQIVGWFVLRWQMETTFQEARRHLGMETQRQCSELAIRRTT
jgi:hypothetical protein